MESFPEIMSLFRNSHLVRFPMRSDSERHPFQDEGHSGNDPHLFPGPPYSNRGCLRNDSAMSTGLWIQKKTNLARTKRPKCGSLSYYTPRTVCLSLDCQFPLTPE